MSIARCVSKIMDRIAPLTLAEKWDNVSWFSLPRPRTLSTVTVVLIAVDALASSGRTSVRSFPSLISLFQLNT